MKQPLAIGGLVIALAATPLALTACEDIGTNAVSIRPIYGWADGCTPVKISGHGFGDDVTATIGGAAVEGVTLPDAATSPLDVGYNFTATTPPGEPGTFAKVVVSTGGVDYTLGGAEGSFGFYYETCPGIVLEGTNLGDTVAAGDTVTLSGCGFDTASLRASVGGQVVDLTSVCSSAEVSFVAPTLDPGSYPLTLVDAAGDQIYPTPGCGPGDTGDSVDTGFPCEPTLTLNYGAAR